MAVPKEIGSWRRHQWQERKRGKTEVRVVKMLPTWASSLSIPSAGKCLSVLRIKHRSGSQATAVETVDKEKDKGRDVSENPKRRNPNDRKII